MESEFNKRRKERRLRFEKEFQEVDKRQGIFFFVLMFLLTAIGFFLIAVAIFLLYLLT